MLHDHASGQVDRLLVWFFCLGFFGGVWFFGWVSFFFFELPDNAQVGKHGFIGKNKNCGYVLCSKFNTGFLLYLKKVFGNDGRIKLL